MDHQPDQGQDQRHRRQGQHQSDRARLTQEGHTADRGMDGPQFARHGASGGRATVRVFRQQTGDQVAEQWRDTVG